MPSDCRMPGTTPARSRSAARPSAVDSTRQRQRSRPWLALRTSAGGCSARSAVGRATWTGPRAKPTSGSISKPSQKSSIARLPDPSMNSGGATSVVRSGCRLSGGATRAQAHRPRGSARLACRSAEAPRRLDPAGVITVTSGRCRSPKSRLTTKSGSGPSPTASAPGDSRIRQSRSSPDRGRHHGGQQRARCVPEDRVDSYVVEIQGPLQRRSQLVPSCRVVEHRTQLVQNRVTMLPLRAPGAL